MNRAELVEEIARVENVLKTTDNNKLKHDYGKYIKKLRKELETYDGYRSKSNQDM